MDVKTYRAPTMQQALALVRRDLGPAAVILQTRELNGSRLLRWIPGMRQIEVTASVDVNVPSRLAVRSQEPVSEAAAERPAREGESRSRDRLSEQLSELQSMVEGLCQQSRRDGRAEIPEQMFQLYTEMIEAEIGEDLAREFVERVRSEMLGDELADPVLVKSRLARMIEAEFQHTGPIRVTPGTRRVVALVGPTGVGKTTTIAKLAANYRLREKRRVGLITVDTYRIAAVEQLRTYADIIDLPMKVVATPREMREAMQEFSSLDLVLMDTAGRSPRDEVKIQELKSFLGEAAVDEVHLVLSAVASAATLTKTAERFGTAGTTSLILTKLDEATTVGNLLPLVRSSQLPVSYITNGQSVPDDIEAADARRLARMVLGMEVAAVR
jgi:flagellar biosynthesis protein FlhF